MRGSEGRQRLRQRLVCASQSVSFAAFCLGGCRLIRRPRTQRKGGERRRKRPRKQKESTRKRKERHCTLCPFDCQRLATFERFFEKAEGGLFFGFSLILFFFSPSLRPPSFAKQLRSRRRRRRCRHRLRGRHCSRESLGAPAAQPCRRVWSPPLP